LRGNCKNQPIEPYLVKNTIGGIVGIAGDIVPIAIGTISGTSIL